MKQSRSNQRSNYRGTRLREVEYELSDTKGLTTLHWVTEQR